MTVKSPLVLLIFVVHRIVIKVFLHTTVTERFAEMWHHCQKRGGVPWSACHRVHGLMTLPEPISSSSSLTPSELLWTSDSREIFQLVQKGRVLDWWLRGTKYWRVLTWAAMEGRSCTGRNLPLVSLWQLHTRPVSHKKMATKGGHIDFMFFGPPTRALSPNKLCSDGSEINTNNNNAFR